jgi:hypothetical protein
VEVTALLTAGVPCGLPDRLIYRVRAGRGNPKDRQLFEAVFALMVTAATDAVPFDVRDLPAYAVAMFERYRADGPVARLSDWYRLEHGKPGPDDAVSAAQRGRLAAIAEAQRDKVISDRLTPQELFGVITALSRMGTPEFTRLNPPSSTAAARTAVHDIVKQLVQL